MRVIFGAMRSGFDQVFLYAQVSDDEVLSLRRVLAHEEGEQLIRAVEMVKIDRVKADVFADEILELIRGNLAEAFEARDFVAGSQFAHRCLLFLFAIAVFRHLFVSHPEKRCLEDEEVIVTDDVREELKEEREQ